jgi:hypothetical protein
MATAAKRVPECTFKFLETPLKGAFVIEIERREDERGFFPRTFCQREFAQHGLEPTVAQAKVAFNHNISLARCRLPRLFHEQRNSSFCREMPAFMFGRASSSIKPGQTGSDNWCARRGI